MKKSATLTEKRLLRRTQFQLIFLYLVSFLVLEAMVIATTYVVMKQRILDSAYHVIQDEWAQKAPESIETIEKLGLHKPSVSVDAKPEVIATWVVTATGQTLSKDLVLAESPGSVDSVLEPLLQAPHDVTHWRTTRLESIPVLTGTYPLFGQNHRYLGTLYSAYSLASAMRTLRSLTQIDLSVGLSSIVIVLPLTFLLSFRSLRPVRTALQRQRNFVNDAAHELRTPLAVLRSTLELAQDESDRVAVQQAIRCGIDEADCLTQLISDLSTLARLETGTTELISAPLDLVQVIRNSSDSLRAFAQAKGISLTVKGLDSHVWIMGDAGRIAQLMVILLENAIKYNREGGVVEIALERTWHEARISVSDDGIGIAEAEVPHIFDRFYRSHVAQQHATGSGIGLAIAAWIVETHRGHIQVTSKPDIGTTFIVTVPVLLQRPRSASETGIDHTF